MFVLISDTKFSLRVQRKRIPTLSCLVLPGTQGGGGHKAGGEGQRHDPSHPWKSRDPRVGFRNCFGSFCETPKTLVQL